MTGLTPGDRVLVQPGLYCTACEFCRAGEQSLCATFRIVGEHVPGTFAEYVVVPARNLFPIPRGLSWAQAAAFPLVYQTAWRMLVGTRRPSVRGRRCSSTGPAAASAAPRSRSRGSPERASS